SASCPAFGSSCLSYAERNSTIWPNNMDPADRDTVSHVLSSQAQKIHVHENQLKAIATGVQQITERQDRAQQEVSAQVSQLGAQLQRIASRLDQLTPSQPTSPATPPPASPSASAIYLSRPARLALPEKYSGEPGQCRPFLVQCELHFQNDPAAFASDRAQVAFMISHLSGGRERRPGLRRNGLEELRFEGHVRVTAEVSESDGLCHRVPHTGYGQWLEFPGHQGCLRVNGLNEDIKDQLAPHEIPEEFEDLVKMAARIDTRLRERETERRRAARRTSEHQRVPSTPQKPRREFRRSSVLSSATAERAPSSDQAETMQLGHARLDPEERRRRVRVGDCFYCGQAGHQAQSCPVKERAHHASEKVKPDQTLEPAPDEIPDLEKVPQCYHDLREVFSKTKAMSLPPHRPWNCPIDLLPGAPIPKARLYAISGPERKAMEEYIKTSLQSGIIRPSSPAAGAGFFFVEKKDGSLRPCIDYSALNDVTIKNRYPLPLISSAFELLQQARIFTKLDLRNAYHLGFINEVLREYLNDFVFVYLDDILIFSPDPATHQRHVHQSGPESPVGEQAVREGGGEVLSSGYHPESNGQTERLNQELETCLRCLVAQNQTTWSDHLTWVEYAHNSLPTAATGLSPFQVVHGYQPPLFPSNEEEVTVPSAHALARRCRKIWAAARRMLLRGQARMKVAADRHRRPAPTYSPGQKVWLSTKDLPSPGPFVVHPTFHVSKIKPVPWRVTWCRPPSPHRRPKWWKGDRSTQLVKKLLAVRKSGRGRQFLVEWDGYGPEERSWIPASFIVSKKLIEEFYRQHPDTPGPSGVGPKGLPLSVHRRFQTKIEKDEMKYNNPKTGWRWASVYLIPAAINLNSHLHKFKQQTPDFTNLILCSRRRSPRSLKLTQLVCDALKETQEEKKICRREEGHAGSVETFRCLLKVNHTWFDLLFQNQVYSIPKLYGSAMINFVYSDPRRMWQGIQAITDYKPSNSTQTVMNVSFLNELNDFYARFDKDNKDMTIKPKPSDYHQTLTLSPTDVQNALSQINARKAAGPDGIPGRVLRACAEQLAGVFIRTSSTCHLPRQQYQRASRPPPLCQCRNTPLRRA
ncbi:hypothetical protein L3Q82_022461, partial [Scortum barcoo]